MDRKDKIYNYINSKEYIPLKIGELKVMLGVPDEDFLEFEEILKELTDEGKIILSKKNRYQSSSVVGYVLGTLQCNSYGKFAFLIPDDENEEQLYIGPDKMNDAYNSDKVLVHIDNKNLKTGKKEGHVAKIVKRNNTSLSGIVKFLNSGKAMIVPDSKKIYASIYAPVSDETEIHADDRVIVQITEYPKAGIIHGIITKNLGNSSELKSNISAIINEYTIKEDFDEDTISEAKNAQKRVPTVEISKRLDLRDEIIFTIDGDDARDFDDAVSLKITDDGDYLLGVHIADVTHYVKPHTALDNEAFLRGTSVYLPDRVIPMLPIELSNGICSLNPHVNRLTLSVFIKIDKNGNAQFESLHESVIKSCERLTYNDVADLLENPTDKLLKKYDYLLPTLKNMQELSQILNKNRMKRGSINFDFPEAQIIVNDIGEPTDIIKTTRRISHKMIEEFMLIANETIAEFSFWAELPFIYRIHEAPTPEKTTDFNRFLLNFGLGLKGNFNSDNPIHPKAFQQILDKISGTDEENMISTYMLRSLMKAEYKNENLGHFGLASKYYCHFTSPIRRYPDLFIHRVLKEFINGQNTEKFAGLTQDASSNSSKTERQAELCERDCDDLMKAAYMSSFIGSDFSSTVSSVTKFGIFVELENTVEGLIRLDSMKDDYYEFDEEKRIIIGNRTNKTYKIGDKLDVILVNCDLLTRQIDFVRFEDFKTFNFDRQKTKKYKTNNIPRYKKRRTKRHG